MKLVLEERGVDTTGMKGFDDFKASKTILEEYIEMRGHLCLYIPKYHCELSPIERVWCFAKKTYSSLCGRKDHKATKNCA